MTLKELQAIQGRVYKATARRLDVAEDEDNGRLIIFYDTPLRRHIIAYVPLDGVESAERAWANAELFAHAREDILALLDEIERAVRTITELRDYIERKEGEPDEYQNFTIYSLSKENDRYRRALEQARYFIRNCAWGSTEAYETVEAIDAALKGGA